MHTNRPNPFINRKPLKTGGRAVFLERVRKGLDHPLDHSPAPVEQPPTRDESLIRQVAASDPGRIDRFVQKAKANTMIVHRIPPTAEAVHAAIDSAFANHKITKSILNARDLTAQFHLHPYLAAKNIEAVQWGTPTSRDASFQCDASITDCRAGLADTGALLVWSDAGFGRSSTLVVPVHIILVPTSRILPDLIDGLQLAATETLAKGQTLPSNIVVINGPSKTADIEMNLVTGVHGPKYLYLLVLDGI